MIELVLGRKGSGKTTEIKRRLVRLSRLLIFDTLAEYHVDAEGKPLAYAVNNVPALADEMERVGAGVFRIALVPIDRGTDLDSAFDKFLRIAWVVGDLTIVVDEIDVVSSPVSVPEMLSRVLRYGRHRGLSMIAASRRAAEVPRLVTSQADRVTSFAQSEPADVLYLRKFVGEDFAARVRRLPRYKSLHWEPYETDPGKLPLTDPPLADDDTGDAEEPMTN